MQQSLYCYNIFVIDHSSYPPPPPPPFLALPSERGHENLKILGKGGWFKKICDERQNVEDKIQKSDGDETFLFSQS